MSAPPLTKPCPYHRILPLASQGPVYRPVYGQHSSQHQCQLPRPQKSSSLPFIKVPPTTSKPALMGTALCLPPRFIHSSWKPHPMPCSAHPNSAQGPNINSSSPASNTQPPSTPLRGQGSLPTTRGFQGPIFHHTSLPTFNGTWGSILNLRGPPFLSPGLLHRSHFPGDPSSAFPASFTPALPHPHTR